MTLEDVQARPDGRGLPVDEVGVNRLRYPITVWDREQAKQATIAEISMSVWLAAEVKGAHLSRFIEILDEHAGELTQRSIPQVLRAMQHRLHSPSARLTVEFPYFLSRSAPVTGATALMDYQCRFIASRDGNAQSFSLAARIPVTSVCPCSKAISDYGAHNQRGIITIEIWPAPGDQDEFALVWIEELIELAEQCASSPIYPLLKRADERHVTMAGYDRPVFVEDMVREAATALRVDGRITRFVIEAISDESIHNHGAFARLEHPPRPQSAQ